MINGIDRIFDFGFKVLYGEFETKLFKGRECGEALDPRNLQFRLRSNVEDNSSSIPGRCHRVESVITRPPTLLATMPTPSSSPVLPKNLHNPHQNLDSSIPISPKPRSCSSGYCSDSDASSIQEEAFTDEDEDVVDHSSPEFSSEARMLSASPSVAMEEVGNGIHAKTDMLNELLTICDAVDVVEQETTQVFQEELAKIEIFHEIGRTNAVNDSLKAKELELLERQVIAQEAVSNSISKQIKRQADAKRNHALVEAKAKANTILFYVKELDKVVNDTSDWKNASDYKVKRSMRNIEKWKEELNKIIEMKREFMILVEKNSFTDDVKKDRVEREVEDLKEDMDVAILSIEKEDNLRALYTLDTTPVRDPVKLPKFSGKEGEDFHMFKEEMERGFVQNRTPRANQLSKLRECLFGVPLMFVPRSTVATIDEAWAVLKKSYGDAYRLIKYRKNELMKVGKFPEVSDRDKGGYSQQIIWFLKVENILKEVLYLGKRHPEYSDVAFSFEFVSTVIMMFPERLRIKLCDCPGKKGDHLHDIVLKIENFREVVQGLQLVVEASTASLAVAGGGGSGHVGQQQGQCTGGRGLYVVRGRDAFKRPMRGKKSKNSNMLETEKPKSKPSFKEIDDSGTVLKVENQNKSDRKPDDDSRVVEKVDNDIPEVSEKEIDNIPEKKVSLNDSYAVEANGNNENELLDEPEATEAEVSPVNDPTLTQLDLNASFVNELQVKHHLERSENTNNTCVDAIKEDEVVVGKRDQLPNAKPDQNISENDDNDDVDVKVEISKVSDRESITKENEEPEQQLNHELVPNVLDEDENLVAEAERKAKLTNEFIKAEVECGKVVTRFEGTFLENYEDILANLDKLVNENGRDDASHEGKVEEAEIKKNLMCEGSRYEMKPVDNEESLGGKTDIKHKPIAKEVFLNLTVLVCLIQIFLTMLNTLLNVMKSSCASPRSPQLMPVIQEKFLTLVSSIKMDLKEDVVEDEIASADIFTVL